MSPANHSRNLHSGLVPDNTGQYVENWECPAHAHQAVPVATGVPVRGQAGNPGALLHEETPIARLPNMGVQDLKRQRAPRPEQLVHLKTTVL